MKRALCLLAAALLCGCRPAAPVGQTIPMELAEAIALDAGPRAVLACWSNAVSGASNRAVLETRFAQQADAIAVEFLARQSLGELARRLDCTQRGTSRSPYTESQIVRARAAKEAK